ncbi:MAG: hypothetical protein D6781_11515 [Verrucomicrobia bacterium]|nr:MAG: hypothetical protein D6781_11515 [Verrucomicrobiota bacterium]
MIRFFFQETTSAGERHAAQVALSAAASGASLLLAGILVILFPQILAWIIAGVMIFGGCMLLGLAWAAWRSIRRRPFSDDDIWYP